MVVTVRLSDSARRIIRRDARRASRIGALLLDGLRAAAAQGAEGVRERLGAGELGLTMRHPASGLAASVTSEITDPAEPRAAVGVPADSPAARYARMLAVGGTITPVRARALAVPISEEAKRYSSPRDMPDLELIPRKGKPSLLVEKLQARGGRREQWRIHWVLVASVTIQATDWLARGLRLSLPEMVDALQSVVDDGLREAG